MKKNERIYMVDFDFRENHRGEIVPFAIKSGFKTEAEAQAWANKYTTDGKVTYMTEVTA